MMRWVAVAAVCAIPKFAYGDACGDAFTQSSKLARHGKLLEARAALRTCAAVGCPETMRTLCTHDLEAIEPRVPSVVIRARDPDTQRDLVDVVVHVDGVLLEGALDGAAREVDPGLHTFRFERAGLAPSEQQDVIAEGEKSRLIDAQWGGTASSPPAAADSQRRPIPWSVWLTGSLAVAAAGVWGVSGVDGFVQESNLGSCKAAGCPHGEVQNTQTLFNVADVAGATTIALAALTTVLILTRPTVTATHAGWFFRGPLFGGRF
jgi:hypothetical protein